MFVATPYPKELQALLSAEGFENAFWKLYGTTDWKSREQCYEVLEAEVEHYFGRRMYSEYKSFSNCAAKRYKKRKVRA